MTQSPSSIQADRIATRPDLRPSIRLTGHVPSWAVAANDTGAVAPNVPLRISFVLARSAERQAAFTQLLADQQNPGSSSYHQWLTPQQVGELYGPTQSDVDALTGWLASQGLSVLEIAPSRVFVTVTGSTSTVATALATSFHSFEVNGESRRSATVEPAIPTAFAPIINSIVGLADAAIHPLHRLQSLPMSAKTQPTNTADAQPQLTNGTGGAHYVTPGDFATIFDLNSVYTTDRGAGQKVAIIGRSRVVTTDISEYETQTGILPQNLPNTIIPSTGVDPGITANGDQSEATLDVDRVIGTASQVQADLVVSASTGNADGISIAAQYEVQTLLDPVMTISFGSCEAYAGASGVSFWDTLFSQAASEGISVFVSSGDAGAAGCDTNFAIPPTYQFLSINYICSSSYATCVGGTQFADTANSSQYWSTTNSSSLVSALGYIPEGAWNEPTSTSSTGVFSYVAASSGGGASIYVPKPSWQTGTGVPADHARDVPDVSFPAAGHDGYFACYAQGGGDCANSRFAIFSGTSAAAPAMAAVAALLNQRAGGPQGNLNPILYSIAASSPSAFHDATPATSGIAASCSTSIPNICNNSLPATYNLTGGLAGYALTTGYDQATGLGSLDVANFLAAAAGRRAALAATTLSLSESASTISNGQSVIFTATLTSKTAGTPTGTIQFYADGNTLGAPVALSAGQAVMVAPPFTAAGSYYITATYSGDKTFAATVSPGIALKVAGLTPTVGLTTLLTGIPAGAAIAFTVTVGPGTGTVTPTGLVRLYASGSGSAPSGYIASVALNKGTAITPLINLPAGSYTITANYYGDTIYSPANSPGLPLSFNKVSTTTSLVISSNSVGLYGSKNFTANIQPSTYSIIPTGTYQLFANGVPLGFPFAFAVDSIFTVSHLQAFATAGTYSIAVAYSGDANYVGSVSAAQTVTVSSTPASYQASAASPTISLLAGASGGNFDTITLSSINGFAGPINFSCSVVYSGSGTPGDIPVCQTSPTLVTPDGPAAQALIGLVTTQAAKTETVRIDSSNRSQNYWPAGGSVLCLIGICFLPRQRRSWRALSMLLLLGIGMSTFSGCGGGGGTSGVGSTGGAGSGITGTVLGNYTITVTPTTPVLGISNAAPIVVTLTIHN